MYYLYRVTPNPDDLLSSVTPWCLAKYSNNTITRIQCHIALKHLWTKILFDFVVFEASMKILSYKICTE